MINNYVIRMEKFIIANGCALRISDTVKGSPAIVLLHGYLETLEVWEDFTKLLFPHLRVIAIDLPGHGISEVMGEVHTMEFLADTVAAALEVAGVEKYYLAGHSMGGYAGLELLARHPGRLLGLILVNSHPYPDSEAVSRNREREIEMMLADKKDLIARLAVPDRFAPENLRRMKSRIADLVEMAAVCDDLGTAALVRGMAARRDTTEVMSRSGVPLLFVLGDQDMYIPMEKVEAMRLAAPQATVAVIPHTGHMSFIEDPAASAEAILKFTGVEISGKIDTVADCGNQEE